MTIVAGCDVGSLTAKAVVMKDGKKILGSVVIKSRSNPKESAEEVMKLALSRAGLTPGDIEYSVGTGYGREKMAFVNEIVSEIACHGKGAWLLFPSTRTVFDIGGQDCKAIKLDSKGRVLKFITNDKCASGTGRFLEVMARVLGIGVDELGKLSSKAKSPIKLASTCTVWAQADVIKYLNSGHSVEDIGAGINSAMANRVAILASSIKVEPDACMTGGVAKNIGVVDSMEKLIGHRIKRLRRADPQLAGAIGAAVLAQEKVDGR
jgi:predicted CoA-substrate-specific enzyme activase